MLNTNIALQNRRLEAFFDLVGFSSNGLGIFKPCRLFFDTYTVWSELLTQFEYQMHVTREGLVHLLEIEVYFQRHIKL